VGDIIGRRETIAIGWILAGLSFVAMLLIAHGDIQVLVFYMLGLFFIIGPYSALFAYMGESYPTRARGTGAAFINAMGPIGAILGGAILTALLHSGLSVTNAALFGGAVPVVISGLTLLGARRIPPGQTLEQVTT
jgi:MFS family permease